MGGPFSGMFKFRHGIPIAKKNDKLCWFIIIYSYHRNVKYTICMDIRFRYQYIITSPPPLTMSWINTADSDRVLVRSGEHGPNAPSGFFVRPSSSCREPNSYWQSTAVPTISALILRVGKSCIHVGISRTATIAVSPRDGKKKKNPSLDGVIRRVFFHIKSDPFEILELFIGKCSCCCYKFISNCKDASAMFRVENGIKNSHSRLRTPTQTLLRFADR